MIRPKSIRIVVLISPWALAGAFLTRPGLASSPPNLETTLAAQHELVASDSRNPVAWNDLGNLLVVVGRDAEAEEAYRQALALAPGDPAARFNLALLLQQSGLVKDAEAELRQVLEIEPRHAWGHYQLGVILAARKERAAALDHYARALAYDPSLTFAENNPHIIDNPLFAEALLLSQRHGESEATRVPRLYGEPDRIVKLMLESTPGQPGAPPAAKNADAGNRPAAEDAPAAEENEAGGGTPGEGLTPPQPGTTVILPGSRKPAGAPPAAGKERRTITPREVPPPPGTARRDERIDDRGRTPPPRVDRPTLRRAPPPPPPRSSRYIPPSRRSSAQLELRLLPEEPPELYASTVDPGD